VTVKRLAAVLLFAVVTACGGGQASHPNNNGGDTVTQTYWYCWDTGPPEPHHLGHYVSGDHYCTDRELRDSGMTP
jgi:hypothetical protein